MHQTTPAVFLIARPSIDLEGMREYLRDVGGESWLQRRLGEAGGELAGGETLVEFAGRACYRSWEPGLNPNVTKVRTDQREYFANILRSAHGSVLEHANYSFALRNVSRVLTHELVRHRAGSAFSQESLRYVRLTDIGFRVPPALEPIRDQVISMVERLEEFQVSAARELRIDEEGVPFHVKKEVTSALRRLAPLGLSTDIVWTANARTLRHVIEMRTAEGAEEELRGSCRPRRRGCSRTSRARTTAPGCPSTARSEMDAGVRRDVASSIARVRSTPRSLRPCLACPAAVLAAEFTDLELLGPLRRPSCACARRRARERPRARSRSRSTPCPRTS
jgi:thymidylate synthase (FAD)